MSHGTFMIDANSLITPHQQYYPFDFAPGFWAQMETHIANGTIVLLDMVRNELLRGKGTDNLKQWAENLNASVIDHRQSDILKRYGEILSHIQANPCYKPSALEEWARDTIADAWLIATASVYGYTLITFEERNANLNERFPSKQAKIPDVADLFHVETKPLFYMMRALDFKLEQPLSRIKAKKDGAKV